MNKKTKIQENKAITLIALVITIIVLIILAGVAINLTLGQNGLVTRAKQASENYRIAKEKEELQLEIADIQTQTIKEEGRVATLQDLYNKIDKMKFAIEISNEKIADIDSTIVNPTYAVVNKIESNIYFTLDKKLEIIKVEVKGKVIQKEEIVKVSNIIWENGKVTVELTTKETGTIEYKVGEDGIYQTGTTINNLKHGDIVYTRVNNNGTYTEEETKEIKDTIEPEEFKIEASDITTDSIKISGSTQDDQTGLATYSYVVATKTNVIVQEIEGQIVTEYTITGLESGTEYIVYMLAYDNAGNMRKSKEEKIKTKVEATEVYAKLYADGTLALSSTDTTISGKTVQNNYGIIKYSGYYTNWYNDREKIKKIIILDKIVPNTCDRWFYSCSNLTEIINIENLDTSLVTSMEYMFMYCSNLTELNLNSFNTSSVTSMNGMFEGCSNLTELNLNSFNTSSVTSMLCMFEGCSNLTELNLNSFNTNSVTSMLCMFYNCQKLEKLDVSHFETKSVTNMFGLFRGCQNLTNLNVNHFNTSSVTDMGYMFEQCLKLEQLDVSHFDTRLVTNMESMFSGLSVESLNLSNFNTSQVINMSGMFWGCNKLTNLDLSNFNTNLVTNMSAMFNYCKNLTNINLNNFNTSSVTDMRQMFQYCSSLKTLNLSSFDTTKVTNMEYMFFSSENLTNILVSSKWKTSSNNSMMFNNCGTQQVTYK